MNSKPGSNHPTHGAQNLFKATNFNPRNKKKEPADLLQPS